MCTSIFYFEMLLRDEIFFATIPLFHTCVSFLHFMGIFHNMMPYCRWKICDLAKEQSPAQIEEFPRGKVSEDADDQWTEHREPRVLVR